MPDDIDQREDRGGWGMTAALLLLLLALYVLGIGPAAWLADGCPSLAGPLRVTYAPLKWMVSATRTGDALVRYLCLWVDF